MKILFAKELLSLWKAREKLVLTGKTARDRKNKFNFFGKQGKRHG
jgi:hypothetical protein